jgi:hypothetical protein
MMARNTYSPRSTADVSSNCALPPGFHLLVSIYHMYIGMSVVIEDYVHDEGLNCSASRQIGSFWPVLLSFARSRF